MLEVISRHLTGESEEDHENFRHGGWCPVRDLKPKNYEKNL
jgi:hypothetical protein